MIQRLLKTFSCFVRNIESLPMEEAKKLRTGAKAAFTRAERSLLDALKVPQIPQATLNRRFGELKVKWEHCQSTHDNYVAIAREQNDLEDLEGWIHELRSRFDDIEIKTDLRNEDFLTPPVSQPTLLNGSNNVPHRSKNIIKIESMKFSTFKGDIRRYPQFKTEFIKHVAPQCTGDQLAFILKSYLSAEIRDEVENCGEDYDRIWGRLDTRYGNIQKLIDLILMDLKGMKYSEDAASTLAMINTVDKAHQDLVRLNAESEMCNSTIISEIESRMPLKMKEEWATIVTKKPLDTSQRFVTLLELLEDWRRKLEYMNNDIRSGATDVQGDVLHARNEVHSQWRSPNKLQVNRCWLHESEGLAANHAIWTCRKFQALPVEARFKTVKETKACPVCLTTSCPGSEAHQKCQDRRYKCKESGCDGTHHYLLHQKGFQVGSCAHASGEDSNGKTLLLAQES